MPGSNRRDIIRDGEIATYHIWSQTALQRYLLGRDGGLKENNEHRREWCMSLLEYMAKIFAVDLGNCHFVENHFHLIVRTRPDLVTQLTDEEVAYRWRLTWPEFDATHKRWWRSPTDADIRKLLNNPKKLAAARHHLSSVSWYTGRFKELIARLANEESKTKGHFWAARFGSRELVDDEAILTCSMYIDVNQIKAGMAPSLLDSVHTAIRARIMEGRLQEAQAAIDMFREKEGDGLSLSLEEVQQMYLRCAWLAPVQTNGALKLVNDSWQSHVSAAPPVESIPVLPEPNVESEASRMEEGEPSDDSITQADGEQASISSSPRVKPTYEIHRRLSAMLPVRPSDSPFLAMHLDEYLLLARAAADRALEIRKSQLTGQKVSIWVPDDLAAILHSRGIDSTAWYATLDAFAERFHYVLGSPPHVEAFAARAGRQWVHGIAACRDLFRQVFESPGDPTDEESSSRGGGERAMGGSSPSPNPDDSGVAAGGYLSGIPPVPH